MLVGVTCRCRLLLIANAVCCLSVMGAGTELINLHVPTSGMAYFKARNVVVVEAKGAVPLVMLPCQ